LGFLAEAVILLSFGPYGRGAVAALAWAEHAAGLRTTP